jgi:hypothetical protein
MKMRMMKKCEACKASIGFKEEYVKAEVEIGYLEITTIYFHKECYTKGTLQDLGIKVRDNGGRS